MTTAVDPGISAGVLGVTATATGRYEFYKNICSKETTVRVPWYTAISVPNPENIYLAFGCNAAWYMEQLHNGVPLEAKRIYASRFNQFLDYNESKFPTDVRVYRLRLDSWEQRSANMPQKGLCK